MKPNKYNAIRPLLLFFVVTSAFFTTAKGLLARYNIDQEVLIIGNLLLVIVTVGSYLLFLRSINSSGPNAFVRAMYGSFILKFFIIAVAAFVYIMVMKKDVNKQALILCLVLYMVYTFIEVSVLIRMLKEKKNA